MKIQMQLYSDSSSLEIFTKVYVSRKWVCDGLHTIHTMQLESFNVPKFCTLEWLVGTSFKILRRMRHRYIRMTPIPKENQSSGSTAVPVFNANLLVHVGVLKKFNKCKKMGTTLKTNYYTFFYLFLINFQLQPSSDYDYKLFNKEINTKHIKQHIWH